MARGSTCPSALSSVSSKSKLFFFRQTLEKEFVEHAEEACDRILSLIQDVVEDVSGRADVSVRRAMFGGRIAHELALHPLPGHLHCSNAYCDSMCSVRSLITTAS